MVIFIYLEAREGNPNYRGQGMKKRIHLLIVLLLLILSMLYCSKEKPWVGTYMLTVNDENRELFETFQQNNTPWPHVRIEDDGKFTLIQPRASGSGVYRVDGSRLFMTLTEYNGSLPPGNLAQTKTIESRDNFQFIMFEGPTGDPWIKLPD